MRAIDGNLVGDTITLGVLRYIDVDSGRRAEGARRAVETTLKLKLSSPPQSQTQR